MLATGILNAAVGTDAFPDTTGDDVTKITDSLFVWIGFDSNSGNPCYNIPYYWHEEAHIAEKNLRNFTILSSNTSSAHIA